MYFFLLSYPILGAGIKYVDQAFDENKFSRMMALIVAPIIGILWAYTMAIDPVSATILLAVIFGVFLKGKIDNYAHLAGLIAIIAIVIVMGIQILILPLIFLAAAALLDEVGNDIIDNNKDYINKNKIGHRFMVYFFDHRWLMKIAILSIVIMGVVPYYFFIAMVFFDEAYILVRWYSQSKEKISSSLYLGIYKLKTAVSNNKKGKGDTIKVQYNY